MFRFSPNQNRASLIDWREWGSAAFEEAVRQDKLVMLYIGAFWCGFCQRMDETTLSNDEVITLLNAYYIPIRVENAQRPDIDVRYNQNGWPTIAFMTPEGGQIATVNYLPSNDFSSVLVRLYQAYQEQKDALRAAVASSEQDTSAQPTFAAPHARVRPGAVAQVSDTLVGMADPENGGFGPDHKFLHPEANDFLLYRYETTGDRAFLDHVALTLDRVRASDTYDSQNGGYYRYSSKPDWSEPHREKLLTDQAGMLRNFLRMLVLTEDEKYAGLAREQMGYLHETLSATDSPAFYGCEDVVRAVSRRSDLPPPEFDHPPGTVFSIIDHCIYTDANAQAASALTEASWVLGRPELLQRAVELLDFLWEECRDSEGRMCHYHDGKPHAPGLLIDQAHTGLALLDVYLATGRRDDLERAESLGNLITQRHTNPAGGYHDTSERGPAHLRYLLTLLTENGVTASFFLRLADIAGKPEYRRAALWALSGFTGDFAPYGVYASHYARALAAYMSPPLHLTLEAGEDAAHTRSLARAAYTKLGHHRLNMRIHASANKDSRLYIEKDGETLGPFSDPSEIGAELVAAVAAT